MSRCRGCEPSPACISLGLNERALRVHPQAVAKDAEFQAASAAALAGLSADADDVSRQQEAFLVAAQARPPSGPAGEPRKPRASSYPKSYEVAAMRESHAKAYAPWTTAEENDLGAAPRPRRADRRHRREPWPQAGRHPLPPQETRADLPPSLRLPCSDTRSIDPCPP